MRKVATLLIGAILGGLIASAVVLLLTPMSGNELRANLQGYFRQVGIEVEKAAAQRRAELERELADLRGEVITQ